MDNDIKLRNLERELIDSEVSLMLIKLGTELIEGIPSGKCPNYDAWSRKIVAHCREHILH